MSEKESNPQSDFMIEKMKERPINRKKLLRRTLITVSMAIIFGLVACLTFYVLEPVISNWMNPKGSLLQVYFPEVKDEMSPEEMLSDINGSTAGNKQLQELLSGINLDLTNYSQLYSALSDYASVLQKSMVTLTGISSRKDWFNDVNESENWSSGVIIAHTSKELLILTNFAPLEKAERLNVTFFNGVETTAEYKRKDTTTNLAIVTIPMDGLPRNFLDSIATATIGSSGNKDLAGTPVIALGNPMGTNNSVGYGVITSTSGQVTQVDVNYKLLQTDIVGSPSADGVLFNLQGEIVGIITSDHSMNGMQNLIMAYGVTDLKKRMEKLSNNLAFAYVGIRGVSVNLSAHEVMNVPYGAYVKEVIMDSPAMKAGIRQGDVIVQMDGKEITDYNDYAMIVASQTPGATASVKVMRPAQNGYKEMNLQIVLGEINSK